MSLQKNKITRTFSHPDEFYSENIMTEYRQCIDEGLDAAPYKQMFEAVAAMPMSESREKAADALFDIICELPLREDYPFVSRAAFPKSRKTALRVSPKRERPTKARLKIR